MAPKHLRTIDIARTIGVHTNTVRLYEDYGFLPEIPRAGNGYRIYTPMHLEQAKLAHLTLGWSYVGDKALLIDMIKRAAHDDYGMALELAYNYLARVRTERTHAEAAIEFLERWAAGHLMDATQQKMHIGEAADYLAVTVDMLRNWERNGLIEVPRDPGNGYRLYGPAEFGRLRVIRTLVKSGYSQMAILQMLRQFDAGHTSNLRDALTIPPESAISLYYITDRWLDSLVALEERAQAIIRQIGHMLDRVHQQP